MASLFTSPRTSVQKTEESLDAGSCVERQSRQTSRPVRARFGVFFIRCQSVHLAVYQMYRNGRGFSRTVSASVLASRISRDNGLELDGSPVALG